MKAESTRMQFTVVIYKSNAIHSELEREKTSRCVGAVHWPMSKDRAAFFTCTSTYVDIYVSAFCVLHNQVYLYLWIFWCSMQLDIIG